MELAIDTVVDGRYRVEDRLGSGAMGVVYRVRHTKLNRPFAIKVLHPALVANPKLRRRFQREAEIASTLRHRNVVGVVDVGESDDVAYIVMELADGVPLSAIIADAPLPPATVIDCVRQLCEGLAHAHEAALIHRDFKPDNVIVERGRTGAMTLRIIDFGIAMLRDEAAGDRERLTTEGIVLGTPHYMAPEHASGGAVDQRIDLFALGVICFEMLTGKMPFDGDGVDVARANIMYDLPAMSVRVPDLDVDPLLEAFTRKLMARQRDRRFASAKAAIAVLDLIERDRPAAAATLGIAVPPPSTARPMRAMPAVAPATEQLQPVRRRMRVLLGGGIVTLMMGIVLAVGMTHDNPVQIADAAPHASPAVVLRSSPSSAHEPAPPAPVVIALEPPPAPTPRPIISKPALAKPAHPKPSETPVDGPTATQVAQLYGVVGRALGHLQQSQGSDATIDLWPRFRHIRINDGIATAVSRRETQRLLEHLQRDVDARRTR